MKAFWNHLGQLQLDQQRTAASNMLGYLGAAGMTADIDQRVRDHLQHSQDPFSPEITGLLTQGMAQCGIAEVTKPHEGWRKWWASITRQPDYQTSLIARRRGLLLAAQLGFSLTDWADLQRLKEGVNDFQLRHRPPFTTQSAGPASNHARDLPEFLQILDTLPSLEVGIHHCFGSHYLLSASGTMEKGWRIFFKEKNTAALLREPKHLEADDLRIDYPTTYIPPIPIPPELLKLEKEIMARVSISRGESANILCVVNASSKSEIFYMARLGDLLREKTGEGATLIFDDTFSEGVGDRKNADAYFEYFQQFPKRDRGHWLDWYPGKTQNLEFMAESIHVIYALNASRLRPKDFETLGKVLAPGGLLVLQTSSEVGLNPPLEQIRKKLASASPQNTNLVDTHVGRLFDTYISMAYERPDRTDVVAVYQKAD